MKRDKQIVHTIEGMMKRDAVYERYLCKTCRYEEFKHKEPKS